jgi:uncharacterized protein (TIRG00374 family)
MARKAVGGMLAAMEHVQAPSPERRYARTALAVLATGVSLYLLLPSLAAVFAATGSLSHLKWYWAAAALIAEAGGFVCIWQLDRIALRTRQWFSVACAQLTGNAVGRVVPGGAATATTVAVAMARKAGIDSSEAAAGFTASTTIQIATWLGLPLFALPAIAGGASVPRSLAYAAYLGLAVFALLVAGGAIAFTTDRPLALFGRGLQWVLNKTVRRRRPVSGLPEMLIEQRNFVRSTLGRRWGAALTASVGATGLDYAALLLTLLAVGTRPHASLILLAYTAAKLLALLPFTPGGLGFVEAGLVGGLTLAGVSPEDATVATFAYRLASFWLPIPAGAGAYVLFRRRYD